MTTKKLGDFGEKVACEYLVKKGFKILLRNYRISFGEIDIIAKKTWKLLSLFKNDKTIHFVEVKTLKASTPQSIYPEEHVDFRKRRKLKHMAEIWLEKNKFKQNHPYQIDVIGILMDNVKKKVKITYFENVVSEN